MMPIILFTVLVNLVLGLAAGIVMYRSDFCVAGMFRDFFLFGKIEKLRSLLLLVVVSMILFELLRQFGLLPLYPFPLLGSPSLTNIAGGIVFGIGMVLAGGCVVGTLYKMGGGSTISGIAFIGLIAGSGLYAEIHPWWVQIAKKFSFLEGSITLPQAIGCSPSAILVPLVLFFGFLFYRWHRTNKWQIFSPAEGYLQPWRAALIISLLGSLSYLLIGMPFGITTAYAKIAAYIATAIAPEHVAQSTFYNTISLNYSAPITHTQLQGGAGPFVDAIAYIQMPLVAGIIFGAMFAALRIGELKLYFRIPLRQYVSAFIGGIILALGSRMTPGCNIWHLFGGIPILTMQSLLFLVGLFPGAYIGSKLLATIVLPAAPKTSS